jgi:hypothetical protein
MSALVQRSIPADPAALREELVEALRRALPLARELAAVSQSADRAYESVAQVLVQLRHQFVAADGTTPDLRGRSHGYRTLVRSAYAEAGATANRPIEKRLTVGVSYWVRKLLIEQYGYDKLREMGVLSPSAHSVLLRQVQAAAGVEDYEKCLEGLVEALNILASDQAFVPTEGLVRSAVRAVMLLKMRLPSSGTAA